MKKMVDRICVSTRDGEVSGVFVIFTLAVRASIPNHFFTKLKPCSIGFIVIIVILVVHAKED